jgi:DNA repair protein RecO (recombination protein O)
MRLLARDDPHPRLFDAYAAAVEVLASSPSEVLEPALRTFELLLLRETGLLPALDMETANLAALGSDLRYSLVPEAGLVTAPEGDGRASLRGSRWLALQAALDERASFTQTLGQVAPAMAELKPQLRALLHYHCGVATFRTRQLLLDLQAL